MNNLTTSNYFSPIVFGAFEETSSKSDLEKLSDFMVKFFQNYVLNDGAQNKMSLQQCIDTVGKFLAEPVKQKLATITGAIDDDSKQKIYTWNKAQELYETKMRLELVTISAQVEKSKKYLEGDQGDI